MTIRQSLRFYRMNPESHIEDSPSRIVLSETYFFRSVLLEQKYGQHININRSGSMKIVYQFTAERRFLCMFYIPPSLE